MRPREELSLDEIRLSDPEVWRQAEEVIEGAFATLRREQTGLVSRRDRAPAVHREGNRDKRVFQRPYEFDIAPDGRPPHMSFGGGGNHYCLGAHLAHREVSAMFREILTRIPDIEVVGEPLRPPGNLAHGIDQMDCLFTARGAKGTQFR
jgi:hypothetical protein